MIIKIWVQLNFLLAYVRLCCLLSTRNATIQSQITLLSILILNSFKKIEKKLTDIAVINDVVLN